MRVISYCDFWDPEVLEHVLLHRRYAYRVLVFDESRGLENPYTRTVNIVSKLLPTLTLTPDPNPNPNLRFLPNS